MRGFKFRSRSNVQPRTPGGLRGGASPITSPPNVDTFQHICGKQLLLPFRSARIPPASYQHMHDAAQTLRLWLSLHIFIDEHVCTVYLSLLDCAHARWRCHWQPLLGTAPLRCTCSAPYGHPAEVGLLALQAPTGAPPSSRPAAIPPTSAAIRRRYTRPCMRRASGAARATRRAPLLSGILITVQCMGCSA